MTTPRSHPHRLIPTTSRANDLRDACVVLPDKPGGKAAPRYYLGKAGLTGKGNVDSAKKEFVPGQGWTVKVDLTDQGSAKWDALAQQQFHQQVAIVLDGLVQSAPEILPGQATFTSFGGTAVISGNFTQGEADDLAKLIDFGALPVTLKQVNVENVSPTLGNDQLHAGILAGIIGLALVALYMLVFYRLLGLVVIAGIILSGMALYTLVAWILPDYFGTTIVLSLAGVTGIIVSVGITVDSYIVYFERMKDEVRAGALGALLRRPFVHPVVPHDRRRRPRVADRRRRALLSSPSGRCGASPCSSASPPSSTCSWPTSSCTRWCPLMARRPHLVAMKGVGIAAGLDAPGGGARREHGRPAPGRSGSGTRGPTCTTSARTSSSSQRSWRWAAALGHAHPDLVSSPSRSTASTSASTSRAARSGSSPWPTPKARRR